MNNNIFYISAFFISLFIILLLKKDLEKFKYDLYANINKSIWIKVYCILTIMLIHFFWLMSIFFLNFNDDSYFYGFPYYLLIVYIIYVYSDLRNTEDESNLSKKLNKYLNYLASFYLIIIIAIILISNKTKENFISHFTNIVHKILLSKLS